jgi:hypothetical protein
LRPWKRNANASASAGGRHGSPARPDLVTLALASLTIGLGAMVADERLGVSLRQPLSLWASDGLRFDAESAIASFRRLVPLHQPQFIAERIDNGLKVQNAWDMLALLPSEDVVLRKAGRLGDSI